MNKRIIGKIIGAAAAATLALIALSMATAPAFADSSTQCATWADLQAALTNPATTGIVLTADITIGAGTRINASMPDGLVIDGKDPVTGQIYTITERNTNTSTGNLYIDTSGTLKNLTIQNLNIVGYDNNGFPYIDDTVRGFNLIYSNVTYNGPQIAYNRYGSVEFDDSSITLGPAGTSQECAEAATVILGGNTTINSVTTSDAIFWPRYNYNNTTPGGLVVKPGSNVTITGAMNNTRGLFYNDIAANTITIGSGATFTYNGNAWNTQTDFASITVADGTASQPTTVNINEPYSLATASTDMFRATNINIGNYCNVTVAGLPASSYDGIYAGNALTIGDNSNVKVNINTAGGTGNFGGNAIYVANASTSTGITIGANTTVSAVINGNNTGNTGAIGTSGTGANSGIYINGPNSTLSLDVTGNSSDFGIYCAGGSVYVGTGSSMTTTFGGGVSNWAVDALGTAGTFKLDQGASLLIDDSASGAVSTNGGLNVASISGLQMSDGSSLKVYVNGFNNNTSTTAGAGSLVYLQGGSITTGQNCNIEVKTVGTNTAVYAAINARGVNLGAGSTLNVDLNATTSTNGVYSNGNFTVGAGANLYVHTASNVTTCQYLINMAAGAFTVNQGATVHLIAQDQTLNYANILDNSSGIVFNSPKSVLIYTSGGRQAVWSPGATFAINNVQQINLWHSPVTTPPTMASGRFASLPTFNWRSSTNPNGGIVGAASMTGSIATGVNASFTSMNAPGVVNTPALATDQTTTAPTITNAYLGGLGATRTNALAIGYLPLTASTDSAVNPGSVAGTTDPGSSVVLAVQNGNQYVPVGTPAVADANGNYTIDLQNTGITSNTSYSVISSNPTSYLTTQISVTFRQVTFDANGGQNDPSVPVPLYAVDGATISAPPAPSNGLKSFGGWFTDQALTQPFAFDTTPITANITLYAKWASTSVVIRESVLGVSGAPATGDDYALANLNPASNITFELVFTSQQTGAVFNVLAYRDRAVSIDTLPGGQTFTVSALGVQHLAADSIVLISASNGGQFTAKSPTTCVISLGADSGLELNFINRIAPIGFGGAQSASNLYKIASAS